MLKPYKIVPFSSFVLRTPLYPLSFYLDLVESYTLEKAIEAYQIPLVKEALNLASPELVKELDKWSKKDPSLSKEKSEKLEITFLKYLARMSSRCTPFGLFAGCSVGAIAGETKITLEESDKFKRNTQFDMRFWITLLQAIGNKKEVISQLKHYPNTSIYKIGDFYRYVEYKYINERTEHTIAAFRKSKVLKTILSRAKSGMNIEEMISILADDESEKEEAFVFVLNLIKNQFLISELDAVVTGSNEWKRVTDILKKIPNLNETNSFLETIQKQLSDLDLTLTPSQETYKNIKNKIEKTEVFYDEKYLFQTDLNIKASESFLNETVSKKVIEALYFLNGIQPKTPSKNLEEFKKEFIKRYEYKSMPLTTALDSEIGIGYLQNLDINDSHQILDYFSFKPKKQKIKTQSWTSYDFVLQKKLQDCILNKENRIILSQNDFTDFNSDLKNIPATFSVMIEVFEKDKISIESSGNVSAAKLLGRFCNGNSEIHELTKEIINKEENLYSDKITAEIVHIPESRTGNILRRPVLRKHEIPYLSNPGVSQIDTISLNDLSISINNNKIILYSEKHKKEVLPCLSNAHNFSRNSLPIYHFLCDLQGQKTKTINSFSWGNLNKQYDFFPRVMYKEIILSKAKWIIKKEEIIILSKIDKDLLPEEFLKWRLKRNFPRYVNWVNSDNTLLLDFEVPISLELFLKSVKNREEIILEEFLFRENSAVKNKAGQYFCNEFVLSFYKEQ
ncbi:lantibiotic dehydratase family protein [Flavobacterium sp. UBA7680]|uniref:lantibiotic dehydratase family protein n=1 Tax=Flavobacterium sp. UBA7680 TaxID=1946559 RepID=UPI0025C4F1A8|nr:lantibiotic dehydratase family protein [Flavobacterium sp. UBA7680]